MLNTLFSAIMKNFSIVIGSFGLKENAEKLMETTLIKGYKSNYYKRSNNLYSVVCASFDNRSMAENALSNVQIDFPDAWIYKP
jgi:cell division protein FtsN